MKKLATFLAAACFALNAQAANIPYESTTLEALATEIAPFLPPELQGATGPAGPAGSGSNVTLLHDSIGDTEFSISSNVALFEQYTGFSKTFTTTAANQRVYIDVQIPFTVLKNAAGASNGTFRLYLDGTAQDAGGGKQWNGYLVGHGSGWQTVQNVPATGMPVSVHQWITIPTAGVHTLRLQYAGSDTLTIGTLRSRQFWQVWTLN